MNLTYGPRPRNTSLLPSFSFVILIVIIMSVNLSASLMLECSPSSLLHLGKGNDVLKTQHTQINVIVLLPFEPKYMASIRRTGPAFYLAFKKVENMGLLPNHSVHLTFIDSNCSNIIAPMQAMKFKFNNTVDVFFGPSCELALAPVARFLQFWNTPLLTAGALTSDYTLPKTTKDSEFFLTTRTGIGFSDMVNFLLDYFRKLNWKKVMLMYEKDGMEEVSGHQTCRFFMTSMVEYLKQGFTFSTFDLDTNNPSSVKEKLRNHLGLKYSSKETNLRLQQIIL